MRSVVLVSLLCVLGGCATVSMVGGETTVETSVTDTQSALRTASNEYCNKTVDAGWIIPSAGLFDIANTLINGRDEADDASTPADYAARIGADTASPQAIFQTVKADANTARMGLSAVTDQARLVLNGAADTETSRVDVIAYEKALVRAQKSHAAFAKAQDVAAARTNASTTDIEAALTGLANEIDAARIVADKLAARYASLNSQIS